MSLKTSSRINFVISLLTPFIGFFLAFICMITLIELITPNMHSYIFPDLNTNFPVSILFIFFRYMSLDFGINQFNLRPIFEEIVEYFGASFELLFLSGICSIVLISPFLAVDISSQKSSLNYNRAVMIRIASFIAVFTPFILVLFPKLIQVISIDLYELHQGFITPIYRSNNKLGSLIIPVLWIGGTSFILSIISIAMRFRTESILKVLVTGLMLADIAFETIFAWPGLGRYFYQGLLRSDYGVTLAVIFFIGAVLLIILTLITIIFHFISNQKPGETTGYYLLPINITEIQNEIRTKPSELLTTVCIFLFLFLIFILPIFAPFHPIDVANNSLPLNPPGGEHLLGTNAMNQDILSRILFCLHNFAITYFIGGIGALIGFLIFNIIPKKYELFAKLLSILPYTGFLLLYEWGTFITLNETIGWFFPTLIFITIFFTFPIGLIISSNHSRIQKGILHNFRVTFSLGGLVCAILIEYSSFIGLLATPNDLFLGMELYSGRAFSFIYPWIFEGPLLFLAIVCFLLLLLTLLTNIIGSPIATFKEKAINTNHWLE